MKASPRTALRCKDSYLEQVIAGEATLLFDGAMGTMLQRSGLPAGGVPELLNLDDPELVTRIHRAYVQAGAQVVTTNTFGASRHKLAGTTPTPAVDKVFAAAIDCARRSEARYIAADIGPLGTLLQPFGSLSFDEAYELFKEQIVAAQAGDADIILIETMTNLLEMKAAVLAAKENSSLPIFATMSFEEDGRTFLGTTPRIAALTLDALGVQVLGINCSLGPAALVPFVQEMCVHARCPVMVQANAGLPSLGDDQVPVYDLTAQEYARAIEQMLEIGVSIVGGCCGTDPSFTKELAKLLTRRIPVSRVASPIVPAFSVCSAHQAVVLSEDSCEIALVGERLNPTGKSRLKQALREGDYAYVLEEALLQQEAGADILDVNVGIPDIDERIVLPRVVQELQAGVQLPLQIDSTDALAIEAAVRVYAGKPLINSVNGKQESLDVILPLAKHYGCAVVGLTLDEQGIPSTAEERLSIARKIVEAARDYGIPKQDVVIDCLVMAAATNQNEIREIFKALHLVKQELGVKTTLGVSNVSFGLPAREMLNASFLAAAFGCGLDLPILNPLAPRYREVVDGFMVLNAQDSDAGAFIARYASVPTDTTRLPDVAARKAAATTGAGVPGGVPEEALEETPDEAPDLEEATRLAIQTGRGAQVPLLTEKLLEKLEPTEVIDRVFVPALDTVGEKFERGEYFLPQLMMAAGAVSQGFEIIKSHLKDKPGGSRGTESKETDSKGSICLATVKGDVHDIGKNIVKLLLENYGYTVYDLGCDVDHQAVVDAARKHKTPLVGLSALMTTTVRAMEETIRLLREELPRVKVMVGGAVLTPEYARQIDADYYAKDASAAVKIAEQVFSVPAL